MRLLRKVSYGKAEIRHTLRPEFLKHGVEVTNSFKDSLLLSRHSPCIAQKAKLGRCPPFHHVSLLSNNLCSPTILDSFKSLEHTSVLHIWVHFYRPWKVLVLCPTHPSRQSSKHHPLPQWPPGPSWIQCCMSS